MASSALQPDNVTRALAWSPAGDVLAIGDDGGLWLYDANFNLINSAQLGTIRDIAWNPDGSQLAVTIFKISGGSNAVVLDSSTLAQLAGLGGTPSEVTYPVAWSPDGSQIATSGGGRSIRIHDAVSFEPTQLHYWPRYNNHWLAVTTQTNGLAGWVRIDLVNIDQGDWKDHIPELGDIDLYPEIQNPPIHATVRWNELRVYDSPYSYRDVIGHLAAGTQGRQ